MLFDPLRARQILEKEIKLAGTQKAFAVKHGLSCAYVNDALHGNRDIGGKLAEVLGLEPLRMYRPIKRKHSNK